MGERTSALVSSRTAVSDNSAINRSAALEERRADNHSDRLPSEPMLLHRRPLVDESPDANELAAARQPRGDMGKLVAALTSGPVYAAPTLQDVEFRMPDRYEQGIDPSLVQLATAQAPAAAVTDQQSAANCCACPPCNLL